MPYPDSDYPSILRGRDKRESQRLLAAAPRMREALATIDKACVDELMACDSDTPHAEFVRRVADLALAAWELASE